MESAALVAAVVLLAGGEAAAIECNVLTPADIKAVTGADVRPPATGGSPEHGCPTFKDTEGHAYLGVERHRGPGKYQLALDAVPADIYTKRTPIPGLGDEAVLMKDQTERLRYIVARKGETTVVLSPRTYDKISNGKVQYKISDAQLKQLAERALTAK